MVSATYSTCINTLTQNFLYHVYPKQVDWDILNILFIGELPKLCVKMRPDS